MAAAFTLIRRSVSRFNHLQVRTYLSSTYLCQNQWSDLLKNDPLISKSNQDKLLTELIRRYNAKLKVGAIDVDVFAHRIDSVPQLNELEHILQLFRKTRRAVDVLDSTHHAVCRTYINLNSHHRLLSILEKRIEYGIFPDDYIYNSLMDYFLENKYVTSAFRVAALYMLQERYNNTITRTFALLSAYKWITRDPDAEAFVTEKSEDEKKEEDEEEVAQNEEEDEDEEETKYVRVPFLRNPYHDGHFDLTDQNVICGKIFHYIGMQTSHPLGVNVQILGLSLTGEWEKMSPLLSSIDKKSSFIAKDLLDLISSNVSDECKEELTKLKIKIEPLGKLNVTLEALLNDAVSNIAKLESQEKDSLINRMKCWQDDRQLALEHHLHELARDQLIIDIRKKRQEMVEKEKLLYFFENLDKIEIELHEAEVAAESAKKEDVEEEYIPPTVGASQATK